MSLFPADLLDSKTLQPPLTDEQSLATAGFLGELSDMQVYPHSIVATQQSLFFLGRKRERKLFGVVAASRAELSRFTGRVYPISIAERDRLLMVSPTSAANAAALREYLPFLKTRSAWAAQVDRLWGSVGPGHSGPRASRETRRHGPGSGPAISPRKTRALVGRRKR